MPFYYGKSKDGSNIKEFEGFHVSPDGKEWSSVPYMDKESRDKRKRERAYWEIYDYCNERRLTFRDAYDQIAQKVSGLSSRCKRLLTEIINTPK